MAISEVIAGPGHQYRVVDIECTDQFPGCANPLSFISRSLENGFGNPAGSTITTVQEFSFSTNVQEDPWDIMVGGLRAIYYFR